MDDACIILVFSDTLLDLIESLVQPCTCMIHNKVSYIDSASISYTAVLLILSDLHSILLLFLLLIFLQMSLFTICAVIQTKCLIGR